MTSLLTKEKHNAIIGAILMTTLVIGAYVLELLNDFDYVFNKSASKLPFLIQVPNFRKSLSCCWKMQFVHLRFKGQTGDHGN